MKLTTLLANISANAKTISIDSTGDADTPTLIFRRLTYEVSAGICNQIAIAIIIKDSGLATESAWIKGGVPDYLMNMPFRDEVIAKVANYATTHPELENYQFVRIDETNKIIEILAYIYDSGAQTTSTQRFIAYQVNGVTQFRKLI